MQSIFWCKNQRNCGWSPLAGVSEAVAKGKIVWAGNMLPVAVRATRPPLSEFEETPFLAQKSPYFYQNGVKNKAVRGSLTLGNACCGRVRDPRTETSIDYYTFLGEILCPSKLGNRTLAVVRGSRTLRNACAIPAQSLRNPFCNSRRGGKSTRLHGLRHPVQSAMVSFI